jgi:undecaprenyl diphosphate synthase
MSTTPHLSPQAQSNLPTHIAIIMDGNGRWAKERHLPRVEGHRNGIESVSATVRACGEVGVKYLTLYAFSVENWNRPKDEVDTLMKYLARYLKTEIGELNKNNVRLEVIGQIYRLPEFVKEQLRKTQVALAKNTGLTLILALSYGGRTEIIEATRAIAEKVKEGQIEPAEINEQVISQHLYTRHYPDPDLLVRTSGEMRVSNYLLWQISYAELFVSDVLWPDFGVNELHQAVREFSRRNRRFGALDHTNTLASR